MAPPAPPPMIAPSSFRLNDAQAEIASAMARHTMLPRERRMVETRDWYCIMTSLFNVTARHDAGAVISRRGAGVPHAPVAFGKCFLQHLAFEGQIGYELPQLAIFLV